MKTHDRKITTSPKNSKRNSPVVQKQSSETIDRITSNPIQAQRNEMIKQSPQVTQLKSIQQLVNNTVLQKKSNKSNLPIQLKSGIENLSGISLDDVKVHYNSSKPAQLQAHAYAQGTNIHLGPGQERHLPHEAWHVVQQKQGRVKPTMQLKGKVNVNDDVGLEEEADVMGGKAMQMKLEETGNRLDTSSKPLEGVIQRYRTEGNHHISNNNSMVVGKADQNKDLFATYAHIVHANNVLRHKKGSIYLHQGPNVNLHLTNVPALHRVTPRVHVADRDDNAATITDPASLKVRAGNTVNLPSECERGAIAIIGAFIGNQRHMANTFNTNPLKHSHDRIANIIARSPVLPAQKMLWYNEWENLHDFASKAANVFNAYNATHSFADDLAFQNLIGHLVVSHAGLIVRFGANFNVAAGQYTTNTTVEQSSLVLEDIIQAIDEETNELEHTIYATVDATHGGDQQSLLEHRQLRTQLIALYQDHHFPRVAVDRALTLTAQNGQLTKYFRNRPGHANEYENNLNYLSGSRMRSFLQETVEILNTNIKILEGRRNERFGHAPNQNEAVNPAIGEAYGIIGGGFTRGVGRWNWHWATVIMKSPQDNVTMEAHASKKVGAETHNYRWDLKMYGQPGHAANVGKTFHDRWKNVGLGQTPVTVLGRAAIPHVLAAKFAEFHIAGLNQADTTQAKNAARDLHRILGLYENRRLDTNGLIALDAIERHQVDQITQHDLPAGFVHTKLNVDLIPFNANILALDAAAGENLNNIFLVGDVINEARDMRYQVELFFTWIDRYESIELKDDTF